MTEKKGGRVRRGGLGKGLNVLFGESAGQQAGQDSVPAARTDRADADPEKDRKGAETGERTVRLSEIIVNENQPRKNFDEERLQELTESVRLYGVLQPLLVQKQGGKYRIIAGERRYRAAKAAGLSEIPVIVREYSSQQAAEISIIENVQRADLNPVEEAMAYRMLIQDYGLRQEEVADRVGRNRTTVTNALRLLKLPEAVQSLVAAGALSAGHARALVGIEDEAKAKALAEQIVAGDLSVRETERLVKQAGKKPRKPAQKAGSDEYAIYFREYEEQMHTILGTRVQIHRRDKSKGRIEIDYYSTAELERLMELLRRIPNT